MKWFKIGLLTGLIIASVVGFTVIKSSHHKGYKFYYYPQLNAYYDVQNEKYIYSIDGAKTWNTIAKQSEALPNNLGKKITIYSPQTQVWLQNEVHREKYGGMLNDLIGNSVAELEEKKRLKQKKIDEENLNKQKSPAYNKDSLDKESDALSSEILNDEHAAYSNKEKEPKKKKQPEKIEEDKTEEVEEAVDTETASDSTDLR